jgi:hypothetical protein
MGFEVYMAEKIHSLILGVNAINKQLHHRNVQNKNWIEFNVVLENTSADTLTRY